MLKNGKRKPHGHRLVVKPQDHISSFSVEQNVIDIHSKKLRQLVRKTRKIGYGGKLSRSTVNVDWKSK